MVKPLSEQLADLSAHAKSAEDASAAAKKETHDKIVARREQVQSAATALTEKIGQQIKSVKDASDSQWVALKSKGRCGQRPSEGGSQEGSPKDCC